MKKVPIILIFLFLILIAILSITYNGRNNCTDNKIEPTNTASEEKEEIKPIPEETRLSVGHRDENTGECVDFYERTGGELSLYGLLDFVKENETAVKILQEDCQMVYQTGHFDVTGDGIKEILLITEAIDCVTCRGTSLIIISEDKVIYDEQVRNAMFRPIPGKSDSFEVKEPIYFLKDGICCPKKGTVKVMEYDGFSNFLLVDEYIEKYNTPQFPTFVERKDYYEGSENIEKKIPNVSMFGIVGSTAED